MSFTANDYINLFRSLFPKGKAWDIEEGTNLYKLIEAFSEEYPRIDSRGDDLREEADPRTTTELIADWERLTGFPDDCILAGGTLAERRANVIRRLTETRSLSRKFFTTLANDLGYIMVIQEQHPFRLGINSTLGNPLRDPDFQYVWNVFVEPFASTNFKMGTGQMGDPLVKFAGFSVIACIFGLLKPAQTDVFFATF